MMLFPIQVRGDFEVQEHQRFFLQEFVNPTGVLHKRFEFLLDSCRIVLYVIGAELPAIQDIFIVWSGRKTRKILKDSNPPRNRLFSLLPHGKWYRCIKSGTWHQ
jgi:hypothetical protein